jgi:hypothetical protein
MAKSDFQSEPPEPRRRRPPVARPARDDDDDTLDVSNDYDDPVQTIIPYKNALALFAYYAGVFSWICIIGAPISLVAIALGIMGYRYGQRHPKAKGTGHAIAGIVFGTIGLLLNAALCVVIYRIVYDLPPFGKR